MATVDVIMTVVMLAVAVLLIVPALALPSSNGGRDGNGIQERAWFPEGLFENRLLYIRRSLPGRTLPAKSWTAAYDMDNFDPNVGIESALRYGGVANTLRSAGALDDSIVSAAVAAFASDRGFTVDEFEIVSATIQRNDATIDEGQTNLSYNLEYVPWTTNVDDIDWDLFDQGWIPFNVQKFRYPIWWGHNVHLVLKRIESGQEHRAALTRTTSGDFYVLQHTWYSARAEASNEEGARPLHVLSYNLWNTNPPMGKGFTPQSRREKYARRIDLFARNIDAAGADIVVVQEVRHDTQLEFDDGEHQLTHLLRRLQGEYQFVYQPAMGYEPRHSLRERVEEGMAILSKYPIEATGYTLLSRQRGNRADENHRVCLHATVRVPSIGLVDVFTSHFSLDIESRRRTAVEVLALVERVAARSGAQHAIIAGDLNAEPTDEAIRLLQGLMPIELEKGSVTASTFRDAWLDLHAEPLPRSRNEQDVADAFTFPSDEPKKAY